MNLKREALKTWVEPIIPNAQSFIKPNLVVEKGSTTIVMNVLIVAGHRMEESWRLKFRKYNSPENSTSILRWKENTTTLKHLPVIISYKGLMYGPSGRGLKGTLHFY